MWSFVFGIVRERVSRDAPILAEILGGAATCDAHHMTEPLPNGTG